MTQNGGHVSGAAGSAEPYLQPWTLRADPGDHPITPNRDT